MEEKNHDAFFDTQNSILLFLFFVQYVDTLIHNYPHLVPIIQKTQATRKEVINLSSYATIPTTPIIFPPLEKVLPFQTHIAQKPIYLNFQTLENQKTYYLGNISLQQCITDIATQKNIILAFNTHQKMDIVKNILNDI